MLCFVISTRCQNEQEFVTQTLTGQSLLKISRIYPIRVHIFYAQTAGLAPVYNSVIESADSADILVFMHDDVAIDDWHIQARLHEALNVFDLVGIAGNVTRKDNQVGWYGFCLMPDGALDSAVPKGQPRGAVLYAQSDQVDFWSDQASSAVLLDGVFLAARVQVLREHNIRFDSQFEYHLYDLDLCRQFEQAGLKLGVWPIALTHQSGGQIGQAWYDSAQRYLTKWGK